MKMTHSSGLSLFENLSIDSIHWTRKQEFELCSAIKKIIFYTSSDYEGDDNGIHQFYCLQKKNKIKYFLFSLIFTICECSLRHK